MILSNISTKFHASWWW